MPPTRKKPMRQARLDFSPLPSSSPARASQPAAVRDRAAAIVIDSPSPSKKRRLDLPPTPANSSSQQIGSKRVTRSFAKPATPPLPSSSSRRSTKAVVLSDSSDSETTASEGPQPASSSRPVFVYDSDSSTSPPTPPNTSQVSRRPPVSRASTDSSDLIVVAAGASTSSASRFPNDADLSEGEDSDDIPLPSSARRSRTTLGRQSNADQHVSTDSEGSEDEDEPPVPSSARRHSRIQRRKPMSPISLRSDGSDDEELDSVEARPPASSKRRDSREEQELREDLDFLGHSSPGQPWSMGQSKGKAANRKAALDSLRRRRRASNTNEDRGKSASESADENDDDDNSVSEEEFDEEDVSAFAAQNQDDDDFLVEDDDDDDAEEALQIRESFAISMQLKTAKPKELFRYAVEWMVQSKINPGFPRNDEKYIVAFQKLDDFAKGLAGSKFQSAAWTPQFLRSLQRRPILVDHPVHFTSIPRDRCDACNRSGHPATWEVTFEGQTYDRESLEDDSEDEEDDADYEAEGRVPPTTKVYYIGKFCMRNARTAHILQHWRYSLNGSIMEHLEQKGHLSPAKIVKRDRWSTRKRDKCVARILGKMEEEGEIGAFYRFFKEQINTAQHQGEARFGGYISD